MVFFNRITGLWKTKESLYWGRSVCAVREYENAQALVAETPLEPYVTYHASSHSSVTAENALRDGRGNVISSAHQPWRTRG